MTASEIDPRKNMNDLEIDPRKNMGTQPTHPSWYWTAMAVGALVIVVGTSIGVMGLLQAHKVIALPKQLASSIGSLATHPNNWGLWTLTLGSVAVGAVAIVYGVRKRNKAMVHFQDNPINPLSPQLQRNKAMVHFQDNPINPLSPKLQWACANNFNAIKEKFSLYNKDSEHYGKLPDTAAGLYQQETEEEGQKNHYYWIVIRTCRGELHCTKFLKEDTIKSLKEELEKQNYSLFGFDQYFQESHSAPPPPTI